MGKSRVAHGSMPDLHRFSTVHAMPVFVAILYQFRYLEILLSGFSTSNRGPDKKKY